MQKWIYQALVDNPEFQMATTGIQNQLHEQLITGLSGSARQLFIAAIQASVERPLVVITHNNYQGQKVYEDLLELLNEDDVFFFPSEEILINDIEAASPEITAERIRLLNQITRRNVRILVTSYAGVNRYLPHPKVWQAAMLSIRVGEEQSIESFMAHLVQVGYERVGQVERKGEFSLRGGILDLYPPDCEHPMRLEWFDDEIDSIRQFDLSTQRSIEELQEITIGPARELIYAPDDLVRAAGRIEEQLRQELARVKLPEVKERLVEQIGEVIEHFREGRSVAGISRFISAIHPNRSTLLDYIEGDSILVVDEPARVIELAEQLETEEAEWLAHSIEQGKMVNGFPLTIGYDQIFHREKHPILYLSLFLRQVKRVQPQNIINFVSRTMQEFHGQLNVLKTELTRWQKLGVTVLFMAGDEERALRLQHVLKDYQMEVEFYRTLPEHLPRKPMIVMGSLQTGFELIGARLVVVTEREVFHQRQRKVRRITKTDAGERIKNYLDLKVGDYVVHVNHGIGRFLGVQTLEIEGIHKDYLHLKYAGNDKLFVPIEQLELVQKYVASEDKEPKIYALGGNDWKRVKNRVKSSVQDIAEDLIKLYAKRQASVGFAFDADTPYQREFETMFPYQETDDQLRAVEEIKKDMEMSRPMDRLLCGDVGYGKTEVAIRAAFKAVMSGKQVAVLVPTTILAQQHYETFKERFADFPVRIEVLNRFRSRAEQNKSLGELKKGNVDILIGTHRILSKDVLFKELGLLIVDEEQRFGVTHKERLKQLKENVDVLTLTATPIPRTLHMSLLGVRDLSVIETPPENRFPVQTYVLEYHPSLVKEAIERELARNGQVFFLYNNVAGIHKMAEQISALVPDARVVVGHGQMSENELESVMLDFLDGSADVLVSTTIIETGVDIPNVNTLIIYEADRLGLSQLYQLRGRVGRSNRIAYAYFTYQKGKVLNEVAEKRLAAIKEFTELGSGFKIAMRDLAIRGAGNMLGAEQHGFINSVGFDLYNQMLKEAITELKGEVVEEVFTPEIGITLDAYIPTTYIADTHLKIEMYKRFSEVRNPSDWQDLYDELLDRFGPPPPPVERLLLLTSVKSYCYVHYVKKIAYEHRNLVMAFDERGVEAIDGLQLFQLTNRVSERIGFDTRQGLSITVNVKESEVENGLQIFEQVLQGMEQVKLKGARTHVAK